MNIDRILSVLDEKYPNPVVTVDSHTAGEPTRLVVGGIGPIPGRTIQDKLAAFRETLDPLRLRLTREPRGHRDMVAAVVTEPVRPGSDFGLIYMDARRYLQLCGHATIGAVTTLVETGALPTGPAGGTVVVDTPSGPVTASVEMTGGRVATVGIRMVPSFVYRTDIPLDVPGHGRLTVDLVYVGGFFAMIDAQKAGLSLAADRRPGLVGLGMAVIEAANRQLHVTHPERPEVTTVDVAEFYDAPENREHRGRSVVIYGESHMDRSPCGTGTTAKLTLLHHLGRLPLDTPYRNESPLKTVFEGRLLCETRVGDFAAVEAEIRGSAQITGIHRFVLDPNDPFPEGFLL